MSNNESKIYFIILNKIDVDIYLNILFSFFTFHKNETLMDIKLSNVNWSFFLLSKFYAFPHLVSFLLCFSLTFSEIRWLKGNVKLSFEFCNKIFNGEWNPLRLNFIPQKKTSKMAKKFKWIFFINNQGTEIELKPFEYFKKDYANLMLFYWRTPNFNL